MWEGIDRIDWGRLEYNYGAAVDIPDLLRGCADRDSAAAEEAIGELDNALVHQGGWICSAAPAALPFLVELAECTATHHRAALVELIGRLAREAVTVGRRYVDRGWQPALDAVRPRVLALLADPDPEVRREATLLAAEGVRHPDTVTALWQRWRVETDRVTRWDLVLALGTVHAWQPDEQCHAELVRLLADDDLQLRLAAVHALAESDPRSAAAHVDIMVRAVRDPDVEHWQHSAWIYGTRATVVHSAGSLLADEPAAAAAFAIGVDRGGSTDERVAAITQAGALLAEWRTATGAVMPFLADRLDDEVAEVRYRAAFLLGCLGPLATEHADRLAGLTADPASGRVSTIGDAAVWALARVHDPRCVPALVERLTGPRLGFGVESHFPRDGHVVSLPAAHEVLMPLGGHADALLDAVVTRLETESDRHLASNLCAVLGAWGLAAAPAVPVLERLLFRFAILPSAAKALGAIGPAAAGCAEGLTRTPDIPETAWALWRTGVDPRGGAKTLVDHVVAGGRHDAVRLLADLGPAAARAVDTVRELTRSGSTWERVAAAYALWRITDDPAEPLAVLTDEVRPLVDGDVSPVRRAALRYLADMGAATEPVLAVARAVEDSPRRLADSGGWRTFVQDEEIRAAAATLTRSR